MIDFVPLGGNGKDYDTAPSPASKTGDISIAVFVISLADMQERRGLLLQRGIPKPWVERYFKAIDMRNVPGPEALRYLDQPSSEARYGRIIRSAEIGCARSHRAVYDAFLKTPHQMALVLEDDLLAQDECFGKLDAIATFLNRRAIQGDNFVCNLGAPESLTKNAKQRRVYSLSRACPAPVDLNLYCDSFRQIWRANAYLISRAAAEKISSSTKTINCLADDWNFYLDRQKISQLYLPKAALFLQDETLESTVQTNVESPTLAISHVNFRSRILKSIKFRIQKIWAHIIAFVPYVRA